MTDTPMDLQQTNGQIASRAYVYKVYEANGAGVYTYTVVVATNSTTARNGLQQQYPNSTISFIGVAERIMQVNG